MKTRYLGAAAAAWLACLAPAGWAGGQGYTLIDLGPIQEGEGSVAMAVNASSQVAGFGRKGSYVRALGWEPDGVRQLSAPPGTHSYAHSINESGAIAGHILHQGVSSPTLWTGESALSLSPYMPPAAASAYAFGLNRFNYVVGDYDSFPEMGWFVRGWIWRSAGAATEIPLLPGASWNSAVAVSSTGSVVGWASSDTWKRGFMYDPDGTLIDLGTLGGPDSHPRAMNNWGEVVGESLTADWNRRGFRWQFGAMHELPPLPGDIACRAHAINDYGVIVGSSGLAFPHGMRAVLWRGDEAVDLNDFLPEESGWRLVAAHGINDAGEIVGEGWFEDRQRPFLLRPNLLPQLQLRVDGNRDGTIDFDADADRTTPSRPFRFWLNDDQDAVLTGHFATLYYEEGDVPVKRPDSDDEVISVKRDLEDFAQLAVRVPPEIRILLNQGYDLKLASEGDFEINLFRAIQAGTGYLSNSAIAQAQLYAPFVPLDLFDASFTDDDLADGRINFIFEGKRAGSGILRLSLLRPDGTVEAMDEVHLVLRTAGEMFQQARAAIPADKKAFPPPYENGGLAPLFGHEPLGTFAPDPEEIPHAIVFVHGFNMSDFDYKVFSETMYKRLWHAGYKGRFAAFRWPSKISNTDLLDALYYNEHEHRAFSSAAALKSFVASLPPEYEVGVAAHSMGNIVASEAFRQGMRGSNYVLMQAAVSASCYDGRHALFREEFVWEESKTRRRTPDGAEEGGYRRYFEGLPPEMINFYNEQDFALRTGSQLIGLIQTNWEANNLKGKPADPIGRYFYQLGERKAELWRIGLLGRAGRVREVAHVHESLALAARSRTGAAGAEGETGFLHGISLGNILERIDLHETFGFGDDRRDHSAQINRRIHDVAGFFSRLMEALSVQRR